MASTVGTPLLCNFKAFGIYSPSLPLQGIVTNNQFCVTCPLGKNTKLPFQSSNSIAAAPLELIHSDAWASPCVSNKGSKYYILFIDDYSKYCWLSPMRFKPKSFDYFVKFKVLVENMLSCKIKSLQTDWWGAPISSFSQPKWDLAPPIMPIHT